MEDFKDFGSFGGRTDEESIYATVFPVRGLLSKWKQPIGYFFSSFTIRPKKLRDMLMAANTILTDVRLDVKGVHCDQGTNNTALFRNLEVMPIRPYSIHGEKEVLVFYDSPFS